MKVLALTATATKETLECVINRLSMKNPTVIGLSPERDNVMLHVRPAPTLKDMSLLLVKDLKSSRIQTPKTVVYCRSLKKCAEMYSTICNNMGDDITEPPGLPNIIPFRLVDIFTAASTLAMREEVVQEFCKPDTYLRVIVATTAFGLGIDCSDITRVINWGTPNSLEELIQEAGRAGRNGFQSDAVLYTGSKKGGKHINKEMEMYIKNTSLCRRSMLYKNFLFNKEKQWKQIMPCKCCDLCSLLCNCHDCMLKSH